MLHRTQRRHVLSRHKVLLPSLALLALFAGVAAFGIAPDTVTQDVTIRTVVEDVAVAQPAETEGSFDFWREEPIQRGDTVASLLERTGVSEEEIAHFLQASHDLPALSHLVAGHTVMARVTSTGRLILFRYMASDDHLVTVDRVQDQFRARDEQVQLDSRPVMRSGVITASLFGATDAADVPDSIASQMAEVFSGDIDFYRDLRKGDRFSVVYEALYHDGAIVKTGRLLAAEFVNQGQTYRAVYFRDPQGREGYFSPDGHSMKRAFLKAPLPFTRISSGFTLARFHPILKKWRAHRGIDYAAPRGTPVRAVADAVVEFAGRRGGYGNLIVLRHRHPYSTAYGHLSRYAKGIHAGARVSQGQIIGYVGMTGLATGPHLHYEFRVDGVQKNPLALKLPTAFPLDRHYLAQFRAETRPLVARLELLSGSDLVSLD
jgi:murein DD-endopeptidase MepM/ murein hydrolase activator NlpD